eukprot:951288_1
MMQNIHNCRLGVRVIHHHSLARYTPHYRTILSETLATPRNFCTRVPPVDPKEFHNRITRDEILSKSGFMIDMDGVIYHDNSLIPGAKEFVEWMKDNQKRFIFLTNSSIRSPRELKEKLGRLDIEVKSSQFYTAALATAAFLSSQVPAGSAFVIGDGGLYQALYDVGYSMNDVNPDFVVVGETRTYNFEQIDRAVRLVQRGARLIGTNPDVADSTGHRDGTVSPACGALVRPIEAASGRPPFYLGKPNPITMQTALSKLGLSASETVMIGDRMDTDILGALYSGIDSVLSLSGVTMRNDVIKYAYRPHFITDSIGHLIHDVSLGNTAEKGGN